MLQERKKNGEAILVLWAQTFDFTCNNSFITTIVLIRISLMMRCAQYDFKTFGIGEGNLNTHKKNINQSQVTDKLTIT
jgi:hypothetical protein